MGRGGRSKGLEAGTKGEPGSERAWEAKAAPLPCTVHGRREERQGRSPLPVPLTPTTSPAAASPGAAAKPSAPVIAPRQPEGAPAAALAHAISGRSTATRPTGQVPLSQPYRGSIGWSPWLPAFVPAVPSAYCAHIVPVFQAAADPWPVSAASGLTHPNMAPAISLSLAAVIGATQTARLKLTFKTASHPRAQEAAGAKGTLLP
ncbi:hypothetical protein AAY473_004544 [Plecturocebus cupreus]